MSIIIWSQMNQLLEEGVSQHRNQLIWQFDFLQVLYKGVRVVDLLEGNRGLDTSLILRSRLVNQK